MSTSSSLTYDLYTQQGMQKISCLYKKKMDQAEASDNPADNQARANTDMQQIVESCIDERGRQEIVHILERISLLKPPEKLLLYLRMPSGQPETDPLRQPQNPLGTRSEINHTINWVKSHLEHDPNVSIPKQDVYDDYVLYCSRVNIKPLSTADFGKVMKQVFPEIRPRRLGTRGNSRYCYAALRKTTKLAPPMLPDLNKTVASANSLLDAEAESINIIKKWAANLLNVDFDKTKDLADYIRTNMLNNPLNNNRLRLSQKKLNAKEIRANKRNEISTAKKRRRKRRNKNSFSSEASQEHLSPLTDDGETNKAIIAPPLINIKQEVDVIQRASTIVKNENILPCDTLSEGYAASIQNISSPVQVQCTLKEEVSDSDEVQPNILCKKVRQAQQTKGLWTPVTPTTINSHLIPPSQVTPSVMPIIDRSPMVDNTATSLMRPPIYNHPHSRVQMSQQQPVPSANNLILKRGTQQNASQVRSHRNNKSITHTTTKAMTNTDVGAASSAEKDDVTTDIIMPRERVISICNLDKDALDDYLNGGDNSQEQEAELLKYFQPDENGTAAVPEYTIPSRPHNSLPILENYQLCNNDDNDSRHSKKHCFEKGNQISELRYYLQQNLQASNDSSPQGITNKTNNNEPCQINQTPENYSSAYAATALSMLSNRQSNGKDHLKHGVSGSNNQLKDLKRHNSSNQRCVSNIPQSPNSRRKNFSFVPISPGPLSPHSSFNFYNNTNSESNPFLSPRATPTARNKSNKLNSNPLGSTAPTFGSNPSYFKPTNQTKYEISASAPPSPSIAQQYFRLSSDNKSSFQPSIKTHSERDVDNISVENRSQSAPLHCQMAVSKSIFKFDLYSQSGNMMTESLPPSHEYTHLNNRHFMDLLNAPNTATHSNIKMEDSDMISSNLLDNVLGGVSSNVIDMTEMIPNLNIRTNLNSMSRSVPSTPQPLFTGKNNSIDHCSSVKTFDMSKSVPTTPIAMQGNLFRYSPEHNRDFLINGNTVEPGKIASFYNNQERLAQPSQHTQIVDKDVPISADIDELSTVGDDADPIIGSDLLNNL